MFYFDNSVIDWLNMSVSTIKNVTNDKQWYTWCDSMQWMGVVMCLLQKVA